MTISLSLFSSKATALLAQIYPERDAQDLANKVLQAFWSDESKPLHAPREPGNSLWSEQDALLITYGNSVTDGAYKPLDVLRHFLETYLQGTVNGVHILPFFPYTSDDGFAVTDYRTVNSQLGDWPDINRIADDFKLMSDLVLNHVSSQSTWFNDYLQGREPFDKFFFEANPDDDLSNVVRPRTHPLLREVQTANGPRHVWCTFSHDQVDLDFRNPEVLLEFLRVMRVHIQNGVRIIRLDAVAFLWKDVGSPSIHLPQTHAIVQLMRLLCDYEREDVVLLTETNVPNPENLSYFGNRNEAHAIYNFSLPPLVLHAMLSGSARYLNRWQNTMPPAPLGCAYLNFTASHDGIGMRPAEGVLPEEEISKIIKTVRAFGGQINMRALPNGGESPYELNITYFDAMKGTMEGEDQFQVERFLTSQTIIMSLEGIPAFYIHAMTACPNDKEAVEITGQNRSINRHRWDYDQLRGLLDNPETTNAKVMNTLRDRIKLRCQQPAFHPNATQYTLQPDDRIMAVWRQSFDRSQSIFALHNVSDETVTLSTSALNLIEGQDWTDLLSGKAVETERPNIELAPYQCMWISSRAYGKTA
ncbi:MAG: sugar phosphorylase [Pseudoruegeria sp.]